MSSTSENPVNTVYMRYFRTYNSSERPPVKVTHDKKAFPIVLSACKNFTEECKIGSSFG